MTSLVGTVKEEDYSDIYEGVQLVKGATEWFQGNGARIEIGHHHRFWEYGSAVQALISLKQEQLDRIQILDIGSGYGALGPTLAKVFHTSVVECEPDLNCISARSVVNKLLSKNGGGKILAMPTGFENLPEGQFDAVTCISVIEHLPPAVEKKCWEEMAKRVKEGGLLFVTLDCVEFAGVAYTFDNLRAQNFVPSMVKERFDKITDMGFVPMGKPDFKYHGAKVFDYTFFRMGFIKGEKAQ